jgi:RNA polymerase sigma factor (sigma-70 family)
MSDPRTGLREGEEALLPRARAGDETAFGELVEPFRRELQVHCYRIVGSVQDAEDLAQETLLAAWRGLESFEGRASMRSWLYRIATKRCLNALRERGRRLPEPAPPPEEPPRAPEPTRQREPIWLEPYPDNLLEGVVDRSAEPDARYESREAIGLAFVAGLQRLPPRQRAVLVLRDVLGFRASETAEMLGVTEASANGALRRARAALEGGLAAGTLEYVGPSAIAGFLSTVPGGGRLDRFRLVPTRANGQPAFGCYMRDAQVPIAHAYGLMVLTLRGGRVAAITGFPDTGVFPHFGLPRALRE